VVSDKIVQAKECHKASEEMTSYEVVYTCI
jgi:hypothetical protein